MKAIASLLASALLLFAALSAHALTVTAEPGVANQVAPQSAFFSVPIAVKVTDSAGVPVAGASVKFSVVPYDTTHGAIFFPGPGFAFVNDYVATTGPDGVATAGLGAIAYIAGPSGVLAEATAAGPLGSQTASTLIPLQVVAGGVTTLRVASGDHQKAAVGTAYAQTWVVEALDKNKQPVPFAAVFFYSTEDAALPSLFFNGDHDVWVRAGANGIATSPVPVANMVEGMEEGFAGALNYGVNVLSAFFQYTNTRPAGGGGVPGEGCGRQGKGNGNCGNSDDHSKGDNGKGNG
jgi:hypothetical protein